MSRRLDVGLRNNFWARCACDILDVHVAIGLGGHGLSRCVVLSRYAA